MKNIMLHHSLNHSFSPHILLIQSKSSPTPWKFYFSQFVWLRVALFFSFSLDMEMNVWDCCVEEALAKLGLLQLLRSLRPITPSLDNLNPDNDVASNEAKEDDEFKVFDEMQPWDRASVEVKIAESTVQKWLLDTPSSGMLSCFRYVGMGCFRTWMPFCIFGHCILSFRLLQFGFLNCSYWQCNERVNRIRMLCMWLR